MKTLALGVNPGPPTHPRRYSHADLGSHPSPSSKKVPKRLLRGWPRSKALERRVRGEAQTFVCSWWAFGILHIYPSALQGTGPGHNHAPLQGVFRPNRTGVCKILHADFAEILFYALG
jgi:hypothetical protein